MKTCGIKIEGSEAIISVAAVDGQALNHVALAIKKITLDANVKVFAAQVASLFSKELDRSDRDQEAQREGWICR